MIQKRKRKSKFWVPTPNAPNIKEIRLDRLLNFFKRRGYKVQHVRIDKRDGAAVVEFASTGGPHGLHELSLSRMSILEINTSKIFRVSDAAKGTGQCVGDITLIEERRKREKLLRKKPRRPRS